MRRLYLSAIVAILVLASCASLEESVKTKPDTNVTYTAADGTEIRAYLATPAGTGPHPAVLMIHEWWGLNEDVTVLAEALSREGYVVLTPDAFRGGLATTVPQAIAQISSTPTEQIWGDLDAALEFLKGHPQVDSDRIATMGFCFGGSQSMHLGTRAEGLAAVITLYGSSPIADPEQLGNMAANGPVLGIFGEKDGSIPLREVDAFEAALDAVGAENTITVYPDIGHAFVKSSNYQDDGPAGQAWRQILGFLGENLR